MGEISQQREIHIRYSERNNGNGYEGILYHVPVLP